MEPLKLDVTKSNFIKPSLTFSYPRVTSHIEGITQPDWSQYLPTPEKQKFIFDTNACMTFSSIHILDTQLDYFNASGRIPLAVMARLRTLGYIDANNKFNTSQRFAAILNGTNPAQGNSFDPVWNGYKTFGLLPEADLTYTLAQAQKFQDPQSFWNDYYNASLITAAWKQIARELLEYFDIEWQWVTISGINGVIKNIWDFVRGVPATPLQALKDALLKAPVHIAIPVAMATWNSGTVIYDGGKSAQHGVMLYNIREDGTYEIFDQYEPFCKTLSRDYYIPYAVLGTIRPIGKPIHIFNTNLMYGMKNDEVVALQKALAYLGYFSIAPTGFYGQLTADAMLQFQKANGIAPTSETNFGPKSRAAMNTLMSQ